CDRLPTTYRSSKEERRGAASLIENTASSGASLLECDRLPTTYRSSKEERRGAAGLAAPSVRPTEGDR
ncbi:MAG: hypothetical protein AAF938_16005, partial [Myxococcota bacterium]